MSGSKALVIKFYKKEKKKLNDSISSYEYWFDYLKELCHEIQPN